MQGRLRGRGGRWRGPGAPATLEGRPSAGGTLTGAGRKETRGGSGRGSAPLPRCLLAATSRRCAAAGASRSRRLGVASRRALGRPGGPRSTGVPVCLSDPDDAPLQTQRCLDCGRPPNAALPAPILHSTPSRNQGGAEEARLPPQHIHPITIARRISRPPNTNRPIARPGLDH